MTNLTQTIHNIVKGTPVTDIEEYSVAILFGMSDTRNDLRVVLATVSPKTLVVKGLGEQVRYEENQRLESDTKTGQAKNDTRMIRRECPPTISSHRCGFL